MRDRVQPTGLLLPCGRCARLVLATIAGLCGPCSVEVEFNCRSESGILTDEDRKERNYARGPWSLEKQLGKTRKT